jgi:hypothetical protein
MFLFFSVARSQEIGSWERAAETTPAAVDTKPKVISKASASAAFGTNMPLMSSAFDTAMWLKAA